MLKPASVTPLSAILLCEVLQEAGLPDSEINLVTGAGGTVGDWLVTDARVAKTHLYRQCGRGAADPGQGHQAGQPGTGQHLARDCRRGRGPGQRGPALRLGAYYNSGQVCLSVQRIYADREIHGPLTERFVAATSALCVGDPLEEKTDVGPMIDVKEAERIEQWIGEAVRGGAKILAGGRREGSVFWPTALADVKPDMKVVARRPSRLGR